MLTESASLTPPLDSGERRAEARRHRREAAAPYPSKREKAEEDEEEEFFQEVPVGHNRRGNGFFARLASYIPIVNKLVTEEEEEEQPATETSTDSIEIQTTQEGVDDEEEAAEEIEKQEEVIEPVEKETETPEPQPETKEETPEDEDMLDVVTPPVTRAAPSFVTQKEHLTTPPRHNNKRGSRNSRSPSVASESGERSPATMRQRKRGDKRVFLPGPSQQSKMLRISSSQHRRQSTSPSPYDSALAVVKQKKAITLEEFERLQKQLHDMVEATPQAQLAMTQAALANGLERPFTRGFPGPMSFPGYVPGSIANQNHGALVVQDERTEITTKNGVPYGKRPRNNANGPIVFSGSTLRGQLTREERLMRKPRPSRLLTGAKRDAATRNAYSAAVAEKILSTLNKVQTPLEREAQKPTPSTSMSWAKYHLSLVESDQKRLDDGMEIDSDDVAPPTNTIPRVAFPQPTHKPAVLSFGNTKTALQTPAKNSNGVTSAFSPQAVSMTPAITKASTPEQPTFETIGEFKFTLPLRIESAKQVDVDDEDTRVRFVFSPPPSMREPPVKISSQTTAGKTNGGAAPFDFMPSSPKTKTTEWVSKPPTTKEPEKPKAVAKKPAAPKETEKPSTTASVSGGVNPLARFMQLKPGQWKCPGCSVVNEASSAKCPCCETANPGGASAPKAAASTAPKVAGSISANGFSFGAPSADAKKYADKSAAGSITAGGFSFGAPAVDSKKEAEKPAGSISSAGFSFGTPAADTKKDAEKPAAGIAGGFSFTAPTPAPTSETPATGGFSFGAPAASDVTAAAAAAPISFGFSAPAKKTEGASAKPATTEKTAAPSFSFGVPAASASAPTSTSTATSTATASSGFSFGAHSASTTETSGKGKRKSPAEEEPKTNSAPSFSFGTTTATEAPKLSGFSFGAASESKQAAPTESDRPKKRLAPSSVGSDSKPETPNPAFSFGAAKPPQVPAKDAASATPSISFCTPSSSTATVKPKESTTPSFSFGANTQTEKATEMKPTTGFSFGSSSTTAPKPSTGFGQLSSESKAPAFSFGAPSASAAPAASSSGFTFGQSSKTPATSSAPAFGAAPATSSAPAFGFGTATPPPTGKSTPPTVQAPSAPASTPAFTFGSSSAQSAPASSFGSSSGSSFGQAPASTAFGSSSSSGFGSGSTGGFGSSSTSAPATAFGSAASTASAAPAFSFGSSSQAPTASAPAANQPAFAFGGSSTQSGFGATPAASSGFGSSAPSGFGAPAPAPNGFRSSSPAPAFGNQAAPAAPAFGSSLPPPTTTFGAPAFGAPAASGFGSGPPSSGFRTPSPTPAFGAPAASAFGATPAPAFGTPSPAFGAPAAGAFGAPPADGGFNMGAAPQHAKGRRILKAKPRGRRTS